MTGCAKKLAENVLVTCARSSRRAGAAASRTGKNARIKDQKRNRSGGENMQEVKAQEINTTEQKVELFKIRIEESIAF